MSDKDSLDVSVIVPTYNRSARLDTLLDDLSHQRTGCAFEVLVVDNDSMDDTARVVERWHAQDPRIHYLLGRRPGASCARNAGIAAATAPILAFIDDDVRPTPDRIASLLRAFECHPELDCLGGRIEPRWPIPPPSWLTSAHWGPLALQMGRGASSLVDRLHAAACLVTANFACRADVFRELGGFLPSIGVTRIASSISGCGGRASGGCMWIRSSHSPRCSANASRSAITARGTA